MVEKSRLCPRTESQMKKENFLLSAGTARDIVGAYPALWVKRRAGATRQNWNASNHFLKAKAHRPSNLEPRLYLVDSLSCERRGHLGCR
jgi:hypothetical protein